MNDPPPSPRQKKNSALFPTAAVLMNIPSQACLLYLYVETDDIIPHRTVRRIKRVHVSERFMEHLPNTCFNKTEPNRGQSSPHRHHTTLSLFRLSPLYLERCPALTAGRVRVWRGHPLAFLQAAPDGSCHSSVGVSGFRGEPERAHA